MVHSLGGGPRENILVISGLPGTGKTMYVDWLVAERQWGCLRSDEYRESMSPQEKLAFKMFGQGDDRPLLTIAAGHPPGFVVEWDFPVEALNLVQYVIARGFNAWYFDGDRDAAMALWIRRWQGRNPEDFDRQANSLRNEWPRISAIYGAKVLRTVEAAPLLWLSPPEIHARLFVGDTSPPGT